MISTAVCVLATAGLALISPSQDNAILVMLTVFVVANVAFEVGMVFYNAFLPYVPAKKSAPSAQTMRRDIGQFLVVWGWAMRTG